VFWSNRTVLASLARASFTAWSAYRSFALAGYRRKCRNIASAFLTLLLFMAAFLACKTCSPNTRSRLAGRLLRAVAQHLTFSQWFYCSAVGIATLGGGRSSIPAASSPSSSSSSHCRYRPAGRHSALVLTAALADYRPFAFWATYQKHLGSRWAEGNHRRAWRFSALNASAGQSVRPSYPADGTASTVYWKLIGAL